MDYQNKTGHSYLDLAFTILMLITGYAVPLHIHMPVFLMELTQWTAWVIAIAAGFLTILNHLGYTPKWLQKLKSILKK